MTEYLKKIIDNLSKIESEECGAIAEATRAVADTIRNDGLIFIFGCGHSHIPGLDAFYRAGDLANVSPMLTPTLCFITARQSQAEWKRCRELRRKYSEGIPRVKKI